MGWFSFGNSDTVDKAVDNVLDKDNGLLQQLGSWVGGQQFTEEEKSEANMSLISAATAFVASTLGENTIRSKTRRKLALAWVYTELSLVVLTVIMGITSSWFDVVTMEQAKFIWSVASSNLMFYGTLTVMGFFFGNHIIQGIKNKVLPTKK